MYVERAGVQECTAVMTFSIEVRETGELGAYLSDRQSRGWRHRRGWYRWGRCVWYGRRRGVSH